jgi:hypothetical protein
MEGSAPRLLPAADPAAPGVTGKVFAADGIPVRTGAAAEEIMPNGRGILRRLRDSSRAAATHVLAAAVRTPVTQGPDPDSGGVRLNEGGAVITGRHLAATVPGICAAPAEADDRTVTAWSCGVAAIGRQRDSGRNPEDADSLPGASAGKGR